MDKVTLLVEREALIRERDRLAAPDPTAGEAEHAALLRVSEAAERVREYPRTHTTNVHERDLDKALAELRRVRGGE